VKLGLLLAALVAAALVVAGPAGAETVSQAPCVEGTSEPLCSVQTGTVTAVDDGDTLDVHVRGAGPERIRIIGINAMEQSVYNSNPGKELGDCHAVEATTLLTSLVNRSHGEVRVLSMNRLARSRRRPVRAIQVFLRGAWHDVGNLMLSRGLALWLDNPAQWAWNGQYSFLSQEAASRRLGLFDPSFCAFGPDEDIPIRVDVHPDAKGNDTIDVNGEWVRITNLGQRDLPLASWWVRDSGLRRYTFPAGVTIPPGGAVTLHVGRGTDTDTTLYWGLGAPIFENPTGPPKAIGDGAYLFDPDGDIRAWDIYPCRVAPCASSSHSRNL
jgi:micrococcal nuclease